MVSQNVGSQEQVWKFRTPLVGSTLSSVMSDIVEPGVYSGLVASKYDEENVQITSGSVLMKDMDDPNNKSVRIRFKDTVFRVQVREGAGSYLVLRFKWRDVETNYAAFIQTESPLPTDVKICSVFWYGGTLVVDPGSRQVATTKTLESWAKSLRVYASHTLPRTVKIASSEVLTDEGLRYYPETEIQLPEPIEISEWVVYFDSKSKVYSFCEEAVLQPDYNPIAYVNVRSNHTYIKDEDIRNLSEYRDMRPLSRTPVNYSLQKVFNAEPMGPYSVGDLWVNGQQLYQSLAARGQDEYVASDWSLVISPNMSVVIVSTNGTEFRPGTCSTVLQPHIFRNGIEITDEIPTSSFWWERVSEDLSGDALWNINHRGAYREILLTSEDVYIRANILLKIQ